MQGLTIAVSGFGNTALTLVAAALFLATAMTITGLDRRIALAILSLVGVRTSRVVIGGILVVIVLSFLVPSATARAAAVIPIMLGIVLAFGVGEAQPSGGAGHADDGAGGQRLECRHQDRGGAEHGGYRLHPEDAASGHHMAEWLVAAAPFSIVMSVGLYFIMMWMMPPETEGSPAARATVAKSRAELGPMTGKEGRLLTVSLILLCFWATEGVLHPSTARPRPPSRRWRCCSCRASA